MDDKTRGAWLLTQSKSLDAMSPGPAVARLGSIQTAGRVGRLYNLLRRNLLGATESKIEASTLKTICDVNGIDRFTKQQGLEILRDQGRIDTAKNGSVSILGATSIAVLEATSQVFESFEPTKEEHAVLAISDKVAVRPLLRSDAAEFMADSYSLAGPIVASLLDLCKSAAIIDEESDLDRVILFNSNTFRDGQYAIKAARVLEGLTANDRAALSEVLAKLAVHGALHDGEVERMLGTDLSQKLISVGVFDRLEVSNPAESVGYITSPNDFQKFGRPFEDDPIDDAKALLASLTYGQTRSGHRRGQVTMPEALLNALIQGREIGGPYGVTAIGEDYKELEVRQVVSVRPVSANRFRMTLLKKDVAELALSIIKGGQAAQEAVLLDGGAATSFQGPDQVRKSLRSRNSIGDRRFVADALDRLRSGG